MISMAWWALPIVLWIVLCVVCVVVATIDVIGAEMAALALFFLGNLVCLALAFACCLLVG